MHVREHFNCEPPTVTNMVKCLELNGFIYWERDVKDLESELKEQ